MRTILAAIDFSRVTDLIVMEAARLARALQGKVVLVTVLIEPVHAKIYARTEKTISRITISHERTVRKCLAALQQQLQSEFVPAETVVRRGNPALHLLEEAEEHDAAFIVMGSHGHTAFFELLLGSTTQTVLKRSRRPVVVIPPRMRKSKRPKVRLVAAASED